MKIPFPTFSFCCALLVGCATQKHITDSLIDYEKAGHPREFVRDAYTMRDLIYALDNSFWELSPASRASWLDQNCPAGVPEDLVKLPESGAQCALTALRLDKDIIAVIRNSDLVEGFSDLHVLRRIPGGWTNLSDTAFPYLLDRSVRIDAQDSKSIVVRYPKTGASQRYVWRGSQFAPV